MPHSPLLPHLLFRKTWFRLVIGATTLSLIFLAACGGFSGGSTTPAPTPVSQPSITSPEFLYVVSLANQGFGLFRTQISGYKIGSDGTLQTAPATFTGQALNLVPSKGFIFAAMRGAVLTLSIDPATGSLTQVASTPMANRFFILGSP